MNSKTRATYAMAAILLTLGGGGTLAGILCEWLVLESQLLMPMWVLCSTCIFLVAVMYGATHWSDKKAGSKEE